MKESLHSTRCAHATNREPHKPSLTPTPHTLLQITGSGRFDWPTGSSYVGEVKNGKRHGEGTFRCGGDSPVYYTGGWVEGQRSGKGSIYYDADKKSYYQGEWLADKRHGKGAMVYPSGNRYSGGWANDLKHGHGTMEWKDRQETYVGMWARDKPHGRGSHVWQEVRPLQNTTQKQLCNRYEGAFRDGLRDGMGAFYYSNGSKYEGAWEANKKHGRGVFTFEDGEIYDGEFIQDRMVQKRGGGIHCV